MGIFNNSKSNIKKWGQKKVEHPYEPAKAVTEPKKDSVVKPATVVPPKKVQQPIKSVETVKKPAEAPKVVDPELEFQMMYGLTDVVAGVSPKTETVAKSCDSVPAKITPTATVGTFPKTVFPRPVYKRLVNKHLTIILVENTETVAKEKEKVLQIVESFAKSDLTCIINYGETVVQSEIFEIPNSEAPIVSYNEMAGEKACLFDALVQLEKLVSSKYFSTEEKTNERVLIDSVEIIGVGTCRDNCSVASKEEALDCFYKVASKTKVVTKYYCLTDEYFMGAAEVGFHSIGAISRTYQ